MTNLRIMIGLILSLLSNSGNAQSSFFIGYETFEMTMNKFQNFAGELGYRFNDKNQIRLMIGEVNLTESGHKFQRLSSSKAKDSTSKQLSSVDIQSFYLRTFLSQVATAVLKFII